MYVKIANNEVEEFPYTLDQLKRDNPNVSFPQTISSETLASYNVFPVTLTEPPAHDQLVELVTTANPTLVDGVWTQAWTKVNRTEEEASSNIRAERDSRILATDYLALSDQTLSTDMATYRQALRDVPSQSGFPFNVTWPTKP
jgi:hypothetical protein